MSGDSEKLFSLAQQSAENDLPFLLQAKEQARKAYRETPTAENMRLFKMAKAAYDKEFDRRKPAPGAPAAAPEVVGNILAVEKYLTGAGWKVAKSKLYQDKKKGLLKMQPDGTVLKLDADAYAAMHLAPSDAAPDADDQETLRIKRETLRVELETKRQIQERTLMRMQKERGELIPRDEMDQVLVASVATLRASQRQWIYTKMPELVDLVGGDPAKIEQAIHFFLDSSNVFFNGFARARTFDVVDEEEDDTDQEAAV